MLLRAALKGLYNPITFQEEQELILNCIKQNGLIFLEYHNILEGRLDLEVSYYNKEDPQYKKYYFEKYDYIMDKYHKMRIVAIDSLVNQLVPIWLLLGRANLDISEVEVAIRGKKTIAMKTKNIHFNWGK